MPTVVSTVIEAQRTKPAVTNASQNARKREWPDHKSSSAGPTGAALVDWGSGDKSAIPSIFFGGFRIETAGQPPSAGRLTTAHYGVGLAAAFASAPPRVRSLASASWLAVLS